MMLLEIKIYIKNFSAQHCIEPAYNSIHINMDPVDYWPMAREYSVWNTAIAVLQFCTADLKAHVLSSAIEQVYNAFFYSTSTYILCQQSDEVLCSHFVTTLNATFKSKPPLKAKAMTVAVKILTYPHHLDEPPRFTMSPVKNMHPSIQTQSCHVAEVLENCLADWYADASLLVLPRRMMMTPQWIRLHLHPGQCQCSIMQIPSNDCLPNALSIHKLPQKQKRTWRRISKQFPLMTNIGIWRKSQIELYVVMNMPYHMNYAHTHVPM